MYPERQKKKAVVQFPARRMIMLLVIVVLSGGAFGNCFAQSAVLRRGQKGKKSETIKRPPDRSGIISRKTRKIKPLPGEMRDRPHPVIQGANPIDEPQTVLEFSLDWTSYRCHFADGVSNAFEAVLPGSINCTVGVFWELSPLNPAEGGSLEMILVDDPFNAIGVGAPIPLEWRISIDGADPVPIQIGEDNSLRVYFPAGQHVFQLFIGGSGIQPFSTGYYSLELDQSFTPEQ